MQQRQMFGLKAAVVLLLALICSESYLRLVLPYELRFETWFTPGIHTANEKFGFVFRPDFRGRCFHKDHVWNVPLQLDEHGFRQVDVSAGSGPPRKVVVIGGASMMFSYGLMDRETVVARLIENSKYGLQVLNTAWPGFGPYESWHVYRQLVNPPVYPQAALFCIYNKTGYDLPEQFEKLRTPPSQSELFRFRDDVVLAGQGPLINGLGPSALRSVLLFRVCQTIDRWIITAQRVFKRAPHSPVGSASNSRKIVAGNEAEQPDLIRFINYLNETLDKQGTKMMIVCLPKHGENRDFYQTFCRSLPTNVVCADLHRDLWQEIRASSSIAVDHYGPQQAMLIGNRLAKEIDALLGEHPELSGGAKGASRASRLNLEESKAK